MFSSPNQLYMDRDQILAGLRERILAFTTLQVLRAQAEGLTQEVPVTRLVSDGS
jgi:hypothetical protein